MNNSITLMRQRKGIDLWFSITINSVFSLIATALYLLRPNNMMTTTHLLLLRTKTCLKLFQVKECRAQVKDSVTSMTGVEGRIFYLPGIGGGVICLIYCRPPMAQGFHWTTRLVRSSCGYDSLSRLTFAALHSSGRLCMA